MSVLKGDPLHCQGKVVVVLVGEITAANGPPLAKNDQSDLIYELIRGGKTQENAWKADELNNKSEKW